MKYSCLRCGLDFKQRCHLENHLNRKNICEPILEPMSIEEVKKTYGFNILNKRTGFKQVEPAFEQAKPGFEQAKPAFEQAVTDFEQFCQPAFEQAKPAFQQAVTAFQQAKPAFQQAKPAFEQAKKQCQFCGKIFTRRYGLTCHQKICKKNISTKKQCDFCGRTFTRTYGLTCHLKICKKKMELENQILIEKLNQSEQKINNTTNNHNCNNITNNNYNTTNNNNCNNDNSMNIHINNYGCENKDYITKDYLIKLLKTPFQAIPKLIEYTHFNKEHPENQNIKLPNKKQPYVKVLKDDKWIYADRKSTILDLIDEKHCELNEGPLIKHIEKKFTSDLQDRFDRFNDRYLNDEKDFTKQLYKETELVMINNS